MWTFGSIAFSSPLVLLGFLALPGLWVLIRALPPRAKRIAFPPVTLLGDLDMSEPPPARTPLWLLILRFLLAAFLLLALSGPILNPEKQSAPDNGPMLILLDNGWETASRWPDRMALLNRILDRAARNERSVAILTTAPPVGGWPKDEISPMPPSEAAMAQKRTLAALSPMPWSPDHETSAVRLAASDTGYTDILWISDGLSHPDSTALEAEIARKDARLKIFTDKADKPPVAILPVEHTASGYHIALRRAARPFADSRTVLALGGDGRILSEGIARFDAGSDSATAGISLPRAIRTEVARIAIKGERSAGATTLLDARSGHPLVGLSAGDVSRAIQPLKSPLYYLERALEPHADLIDGPPNDLLDKAPGVLILADVGQLPPQTESRIAQWVTDGGLLIRFAGPRMATGTDSLVPTRLRTGERAVGGALSWEEPQSLGDFNPNGPFAGLTPTDTVTVSRQLLAIPDPYLSDRTWARLADGTPLVTAASRGDGWIVLFHTTANADWSSLVLSGLFVDMLERLLQLALLPQGSLLPGDGPDSLAPQTLLDGFGDFGPVRDNIASIPTPSFARTVAGPDHPPGLYGTQAATLALPLQSKYGPIDKNFRFRAANRTATAIDGDDISERPLAPPLFWIAALLLLADMIASLVMRGYLSRPRPRGAAVAFFLLTVLSAMITGPAAMAQDNRRLDDAWAEKATTATRIAYVKTGDDRIDSRSHAALYGLGRVLELRTAVTLGEPVAIDPDQDPLILFPLIYWPVLKDTPALSPQALLNLATFLHSGGIVLIDTGVGDMATGIAGIEDPAMRQALQRMIGHLDLPPLTEVDHSHVLARSFYLLDEFPGRLSGRSLWASENSTGTEPRVSPILIGSHDWASAWALDEFDHFIVPDIAGGNRQRELSFRFGVNLVMYALTGTYKADQLHLPALIERLGE